MQEQKQRSLVQTQRDHYVTSQHFHRFGCPHLLLWPSSWPWPLCSLGTMENMMHKVLLCIWRRYKGLWQTALIWRSGEEKELVHSGRITTSLHLNLELLSAVWTAVHCSYSTDFIGELDTAHPWVPSNTSVVYVIIHCLPQWRIMHYKTTICS